MVGAEVLTIGTDAWVQVVNDDARAQGGYRARRAWGQDVWQAEKDKEKANKVAQQVRRAATLTAELAAQSEKKTATVCDQPPGLDELAGHIEAPNMGAGGSHPQATMMPDPCATFKCPSANQAMVTSPFSASQSFSNFSGKSRKGQPRSDTRTQQVKERDRWGKQEEEKQRLQDKKEEAWQLFQRQPSWGPKRREDFEREYKQKVSAGPLYSPFGSDKREEKVLAGMGRQVARGRSGRRPKEGSQGMPENGTRRFQLPKSAKVGEDMGTEESRSIVVPNYFRFL